jgi:hypothetical protein
MKKKVLIASTVVGVGILAYLFIKRPKGTIYINPDGSGNVDFGNKPSSFEKGQCVEVSTWNGWRLNACADYRKISRFGTTYIEGGISEYDLGDSQLEIIHIK